MVAVPTLLTDVAGVEKLVEALEVRFLANRDANLHFALLTDFPDADQESLPTDERLLQLARDGISALNRTYCRSGIARTTFSICCIVRAAGIRSNARGWAVSASAASSSDLNALLRGNAGDAFSLIVGNTEPLLHVKYVITLDTDTQLPRDSARQLVGAMAHPLNWPQFDRPRFSAHADSNADRPSASRRDTSSPPATEFCSRASQSACRRLAAHPTRGFTAASPASTLTPAPSRMCIRTRSMRARSSAKAFTTSMRSKARLRIDFPDNRILSHDLLEGCYARSGLLSDVQLYEQFPSRYSADVARRHRWIRGDWQLMWLAAAARAAA